jgi:hypothetical protein
LTVETETFTAGSGETKISPPVFLAAYCLLAALSFSCFVVMNAGAGAVFASLLLADVLLLVVRMLVALGISVT